MKTFAQAIDDIIAALVAHASDIGVSPDAIVEGGEMAVPPCINILVAPALDEVLPENGQLSKALAEVEIRLITEGAISDKNTRRDAVVKAGKIFKALRSEKILMKNYTGFAFDTMTVAADATVMLIEFQTYFSLI